jgi:hypothetical protein
MLFLTGNLNGSSVLSVRRWYAFRSKLFCSHSVLFGRVFPLCPNGIPGPNISLFPAESFVLFVQRSSLMVSGFFIRTTPSSPTGRFNQTILFCPNTNTDLVRPRTSQAGLLFVLLKSFGMCISLSLLFPVFGRHNQITMSQVRGILFPLLSCLRTKLLCLLLHTQYLICMFCP